MTREDGRTGGGRAWRHHGRRRAAEDREALLGAILLAVIAIVLVVLAISVSQDADPSVPTTLLE